MIDEAADASLDDDDDVTTCDTGRDVDDEEILETEIVVGIHSRDDEGDDDDEERGWWEAYTRDRCVER